MSSTDQLTAFLAAEGIPIGDLGTGYVIVNGRERAVGAPEMMALMESVANSSQLRSTLYFWAEAEDGTDTYIRPVNGNTWETFNPKAPLTVADIT